MNIVTVVQARRGSSRLPDKVLKPILGVPVLLRMLERVKSSTLHGRLVVATTQEEPDREIVTLCGQNNIHCYTGSAYDLLDRHYQVGLIYHADSVVKIPSDCPLIDPKIIDDVLQYYISNSNDFDYVSNLHPTTWPDGNDVEIISMKALTKAWNEAKKDLEREHTTPYIWENPDKFKIGSVVWNKDYSTSHRWTLDYPEDFELIKRIYEELYPTNPHFGLQDILDLLDQKPEIAQINKNYAGQYWYKNHLAELKHIDDKWKNK
jgi:spore coat polysaccharide biosynthesis protein SpsF